MVGFPNRWLIATIYLTGLKFVGLLEWIKSNQCGPLEADTFGRSTPCGSTSSSFISEPENDATVLPPWQTSITRKIFETTRSITRSYQGMDYAMDALSRFGYQQYGGLSSPLATPCWRSPVSSSLPPETCFELACASLRLKMNT